jgi:hypothetical protein
MMMMISYRQTQLVYLIYFIPTTHLYSIGHPLGRISRTVTTESTIVHRIELLVDNMEIQRIYVTNQNKKLLV